LRAAIVLTVVAGALLGPATPAFAHGGEAPDATAYRTTVTGISPAEPGLRVRAVEGGARLELTNDTGRTVEILGYAGEPYLEVRPDGTYENVHSPAAYLNRTLAGDTPVPATADPAAPPQWRRVAGEPEIRWHDQRARWTGDDLPPAAQAEPDRRHRLRDWTVPLREQTRTLEIRGTLDYLPPPPAWAWWAGALLLAGAVTAAALRWPVTVAGAGPVAGALLAAYGVLRAIDSGISAVLFGTAAVAVAAGIWRTPFVTALAGAVLAIFGGFADLRVFAAAVVPVAGPSWLARVAVLVAIGAGVAMAANGVLRLRDMAVPSPAPGPPDGAEDPKPAG
jgi:hypothetical protein